MMQDTRYKIHEKGFTLIELLVVIGIIGILSSTILVGMNTTRKQGRDARRIVDLRQVQNALELYFQKNSAYPSSGTWAALTTSLTTGSDAPGGISSIPNDPLSTQTYGYCYKASDRSSYILEATLEDVNNKVLTDDIDSVPSGYSCTVGVTCADPQYCLQL